ncbi:MAG: sulfotransferase family 2 domain-containing protein [Desulfobacteraceae bacterium]|jgi:hypothetical protein
MISLKERYIFVHVPKTAGTSIKRYLAGYDMKRNFRPTPDFRPDPDDILYLYQHLTAEQLREELRTHDSAVIERSFFQFAFVRNPWDRVLSAFVYLSHGGGGSLKDLENAWKLKAFNLSFKSFVKDGLQHFGENVSHFLPQYHWTHKNLSDIPIDYIGRFENLQVDLEKILMIIRPGQSFVSDQFPWLRKSDHDHYSVYYDDETKDLVADFYREDIKLLGYEFENKTGRK